MTEAADVRLGLMEKQLDQVGDEVRGMRDSLVALVQLGERQTSTLERLASLAATVADHETRLRAVEKHQPQLVETRTWLISAASAVIAAGASLLISIAAVRREPPPVLPRTVIETPDRRTTPN